MPAAPLIMVSANQAWNLVNFREGVIRALLADGYRVMAVSPDDPKWCARLRAMGCECAALDLDAAGTAPWRELHTLVALIRLIRRHRPVAWLSWTIKPNCYGAIAARLAGVPALPNVSGLGTAFIRRSLLTVVASLLYRIALRRCPTVFFQNADDQGLFVERGLVRPDQARLLPGSGIDLARFAPAGPRAATGGQFVMIARLLADKGVREYVAAARSVRAEFPAARFVLIGEVGVANRTAIAREELQAWIAEGVITYHAPVEDVRDAIAAADWVVLPSYREGLSRVLVEAAALGRPMITTDCPGCRDVVGDGQNGFLVPPRDGEALARAMRRALALENTQWHAMAKASRRIAEDRYSVERVVALYRAALADVGVIARR